MLPKQRMARFWLVEEMGSELAQIAEDPVDINPKGQLQELLQAISPRSPNYELISQTGPEHQKTFIVRVVWLKLVVKKYQPAVDPA